MRKFLKNNIIGFIIGVLLTSSIGVYAAYQYKAKDIGYTPEDKNWKVDNIEEAINQLYKSGYDLEQIVKDNTEEVNGLNYYYKTNIIFGGYCWKIISTSNGETRAIYNGDIENNQCLGSNAKIGTSKYSETYNVTEYANSTVKTTIDNWYNEHIRGDYGTKANGMDLITKEEAEIVGGGYLALSEAYWTKSASGTDTTTTSTCTYTQCGGTETCNRTSSGIYKVNSDGTVSNSDNGTYSACETKTKTCNGACTTWYYWANGNRVCGAPMSGGNDCCQWKQVTGTCTAPPAGSSLAIRPVITLNANNTVKSGDGTTTNPYVIE